MIASPVINIAETNLELLAMFAGTRPIGYHVTGGYAMIEIIPKQEK